MLKKTYPDLLFNCINLQQTYFKFRETPIALVEYFLRTGRKVNYQDTGECKSLQITEYPIQLLHSLVELDWIKVNDMYSKRVFQTANKPPLTQRGEQRPGMIFIKRRISSAVKD